MFASGIGKAMAVKLAEQNINVVVVALADALLDSTISQMESDFPDLQFRKVSYRDHP